MREERPAAFLSRVGRQPRRPVPKSQSRSQRGAGLCAWEPLRAHGLNVGTHTSRGREGGGASPTGSRFAPGGQHPRQARGRKPGPSPEARRVAGSQARGQACKPQLPYRAPRRWTT